MHFIFEFSSQPIKTFWLIFYPCLQKLLIFMEEGKAHEYKKYITFFAVSHRFKISY